MITESKLEIAQLANLEYELLINQKLFDLKIINEKQYREVEKIITGKIKHYKNNN